MLINICSEVYEYVIQAWNSLTILKSQTWNSKLKVLPENRSTSPGLNSRTLGFETKTCTRSSRAMYAQEEIRFFFLGEVLFFVT